MKDGRLTIGGDCKSPIAIYKQGVLRSCRKRGEFISAKEAIVLLFAWYNRVHYGNIAQQIYSRRALCPIGVFGISRIQDGQVGHVRCLLADMERRSPGED